MVSQKGWWEWHQTNGWSHQPVQCPGQHSTATSPAITTLVSSMLHPLLQGTTPLALMPQEMLPS